MNKNDKSKTYEYAIYIGRFQPFHQGHLACVHEGLKIANRIIILIGSVNQPRSQKNPWDYKERRRMVRASFCKEQNQRIAIAGVRDYNDDRKWIKSIKTTVNRITQMGSDSIVLIGHIRDDSSYYLENFPNWDLVELPEYQTINATQIRKQILAAGDIQSVTRPVADKIRHFINSNTFKALVNNTPTNNTCPAILDGTLDAI